MMIMSMVNMSDQRTLFMNNSVGAIMKTARKMMVMVIMFVMIFSVGIIPAEAAAKSPAVKQCETVEKCIKKAL